VISKNNNEYKNVTCKKLKKNAWLCTKAFLIFEKYKTPSHGFSYLDQPSGFCSCFTS